MNRLPIDTEQKQLAGKFLFSMRDMHTYRDADVYENGLIIHLCDENKAVFRDFKHLEYKDLNDYLEKVATSSERKQFYLDYVNKVLEEELLDKDDV